MPFDRNVLANLEATLDGLSSPTAEEAYDALLPYETPMVASSAARRALAGGGGGGSQPLQSGEDTPVGTVTPTATGYVYIDLTNGAIWVAVGPTNTDWVAVGGIADALRNGDGTYGVGYSVSGDLILLSSGHRAVEILTADGMAGLGNGLTWGGADGAETLNVVMGSSGQYTQRWASNGVYTNANGIIFPTADPHVAGAWWDDAGTLTKSLG